METFAEWADEPWLKRLDIDRDHYKYDLGKRHSHFATKWAANPYDQAILNTYWFLHYFQQSQLVALSLELHF